MRLTALSEVLIVVFVLYEVEEGWWTEMSFRAN